jgi:hypothetical protein
MERSATSLLALSVACTFAAAIFGFGSAVFSWRSVYEEQMAREQLISLSRIFVYLALALLLVFRGGWRGVLAAVAMVVGATLVEWALWPFAFEWASVSDPSGYEEKLGERIGRPTYLQLATFDVMAVGISAALAQGLRMMAHVNPRGRQDE